MDVINRDINVFKSDCDMVCLYNINDSLDVLIGGSWSIRDLETKVLWYGSQLLEHFGG